MSCTPNEIGQWPDFSDVANDGCRCVHCIFYNFGLKRIAAIGIKLAGEKWRETVSPPDMLRLLLSDNHGFGNVMCAISTLMILIERQMDCLQSIDKQSRVRLVKESLDKSSCILCEDAVRDHVIIPCGHLIMCGPCTHKLRVASHSEMFRCPVCRRHITNIFKTIR